MSKGLKTKEKILTASKGVFSSYGFHAATLDQIAKRARVPKPLIVHYFGGKSDLLNATIEKILKEFTDELQSQDLENKPASIRIDSIFESNISLAKKDPAATRLLVLLYAHATWDSESKKVYDRVRAAARSRYRRAIEAGIREGFITSQNLDLDRLPELYHQWIIGMMIDFLRSDQDLKIEYHLREKWKLLKQMGLGVIS